MPWTLNLDLTKKRKVLSHQIKRVTGKTISKLLFLFFTASSFSMYIA